jgi:hypothetical protein
MPYKYRERRLEEMRKYYRKNRKYLLAQCKKYIKSHMKEHRLYGVAWTYGITAKEVKAIRSKGCGICGSHKRLCIDHDHKTGKIRGALCWNHNLFVGYLERDMKYLSKALRWIEK